MRRWLAGVLVRPAPPGPTTAGNCRAAAASDERVGLALGLVGGKGGDWTAGGMTGFVSMLHAPRPGHSRRPACWHPWRHRENTATRPPPKHRPPPVTPPRLPSVSRNPPSLTAREPVCACRPARTRSCALTLPSPPPLPCPPPSGLGRGPPDAIRLGIPARAGVVFALPRYLGTSHLAGPPSPRRPLPPPGPPSSPAFPRRRHALTAG